MRDKRMTAWEQWVHRPQSHWLRSAIFQVHLWTGIALSLYIFVVCLSGSLAVFNSELYTAFLPNPKAVAIVGTRLAGAKLRAAAQQAYPATTVTRIVDYRQPGTAVVAYLGGTGVNAKQRFFDPYTAKDIGNARPLGLQMVSWFSQMHMDLMMGYRGRAHQWSRRVFLRGALPHGIGHLVAWNKTLAQEPGASLRYLPQAAELGSPQLCGLLDARVGFYVGIHWRLFGVPEALRLRPSTSLLALRALHRVNLEQMSHSLHVGNFAGWPVKALWVVLGLAPPVLVVTGFLMWWNRVVSRWLARKPLAQRPRVTTASPANGSFRNGRGSGSSPLSGGS